MNKEYLNNGLLKTKYSIPGLNQQILSRTAFNHSMENVLNHRITIITAPAGYGKSSAVLKWLEKISLPHAWLSMDAYDNDVLLFWRYLCAALDNILDGISRDLQYVFSSYELFQANVHINILIDKLSDLDSDCLLVLDDIHTVTNSTVIDSLSYFISYLPYNFHLILISRMEPDLKLEKYGIKEDLIRVRTDALRFQTEEISRFYEMRGYKFKEDELVKIECYTEGWAAALVAVAISLKEEKDIHNKILSFGNCNLHIENYLSEEVFHTWTKEEQDFMEKTSILDRMCVPLCEAITGYEGNTILKQLYYQNSFLIALDEEGIWFRYHHLFSDFLRNNLIKKNPFLIRELYRKAGEWLEAFNLHDEAIELYLRGEFYKEVLPIIECYGSILIKQAEYETVISWINRLPEKYHNSSPMILAFRAAYHTKMYDFKRAWEYIKLLEYTLKTKSKDIKDVNTAYLMTKVNLFIKQGNNKEALNTIIKAVSSGIDKAMNTNYMDLNKYDISMYRSEYHVLLDMIRNNSPEFKLFAEKYRNLITIYPGYSPLMMGEFLYESGRWVEAIPELTTSIDEALNAKCPGAYIPAMITMAKIKRIQGDITSAMDIMNECKSRIPEFHKPHWNYIIKSFEIRLNIDTKKTELLDQWLKDSKLSIFQDNTRTHEYELIVFARVLIYKKRYQDAEILLHRLLRAAENYHRVHSVVEIINLLAFIAMEEMKEEEAFIYVKKSLSIGIEQGYIQSYVDELYPMITLLNAFTKEYKKNDKLMQYAKELLNLTKEAMKNSIYSSDSQELMKLLTPMEKKVLHLIINAYSNKEIAEELCITPRTASAHTVNIYKKLGVKSRTQCIKRVNN